MQVTLCVSLSQIGTGGIELGFVFAPDQIILGCFQAICDILQFGSDNPGDGVLQNLIVPGSLGR